jgi:Ca2+-binding RTX toxin-like protein
MRRVTLMLAAVGVMVGLFAAVAYAATIEGTNQQDIITESNLNDTIFARGGAYIIDATPFTNDTDRANGNAGNDEIDARDNDDRNTLNGGNGDDVCFGDPGDEFISCEEEIVGSSNENGV